MLAEYEYQVIMEMIFPSECSSFAGGLFSQVANQRASLSQLASQLRAPRWGWFTGAHADFAMGRHLWPPSPLRGPPHHGLAG